MGFFRVNKATCALLECGRGPGNKPSMDVYREILQGRLPAAGDCTLRLAQRTINISREIQPV